MSKLLVCTVFIFVRFLLERGTADLKCPTPPVSAQLYFDVEQIALTVLNDHTKFIKLPQICKSENDPICSSQVCCPGEVGCCFANPINHVKKCGCRKLTDETCIYPAPYAVIGGSACEAHKSANMGICFRENRGSYIGQYTLSKNSSIDILKSTRNDDHDLAVPTPTGDVSGHWDYAANEDSGERDLETIRRFSASQLVQKLYKPVLDEIVENVLQLRTKGMTYGKNQ